nr:Mur ligase family protein [bacterium]
MRYREALEYLYSLRLFGTKLGLDNIREVLRRLDHPEANIDFYHVAGTNGKGSTCAFLNSLLGLTRTRVGCFTSPHLEDFRERIRVDGKAIGKKEVCRLLERLAPVLEGVARAPGCAHPTYFEAVTALALCYFRERGVEAAVWEVGMGGRLDATNAVVPKVAVVTTVAMDHSAYLGNDLESIAAEKAGIVKSGVPTVTGDLPPEAQGVVK